MQFSTSLFYSVFIVSHSKTFVVTYYNLLSLITLEYLIKAVSLKYKISNFVVRYKSNLSLSLFDTVNTIGS